MVTIKHSNDNDFKIDIQTKFEKLLATKFPLLKSVDKWNQEMWHNNGNLVISLIFLKKTFKFCFFNNSNLQLDKLQRWSTTIYSRNYEFGNDEKIDWFKIEKLIEETLNNQ